MRTTPETKARTVMQVLDFVFWGAELQVAFEEQIFVVVTTFLQGTLFLQSGNSSSGPVSFSKLSPSLYHF